MQEMEKDEWARGDPRELAAREKEELDKPFEQERAEMARTKEEQEKKPQEAPGKATLEAGREEESIAIPQAKQKLNFKDMMYDLRSTMAGKENFVKMRFQGILWTEFHRTTLENAAQIGTGTMPACQFRWMLFHAMADRLNPGRIPEDADPFKDKTTLENRPTIDFRSLFKVVTIPNDIDPIEPIWKLGNIPGLGSPSLGAIGTRSVESAQEETHSIPPPHNHLGKEFDSSELGSLLFLNKRIQTIGYLGKAIGLPHFEHIKAQNSASRQRTLADKRGKRKRSKSRGEFGGLQQTVSTQNTSRYSLRSKSRQVEDSNRKHSKRSSSSSESEYRPVVDDPVLKSTPHHMALRPQTLTIRAKKGNSPVPASVRRTEELKLKGAPSAIWYTSQKNHQSKNALTTNKSFIKPETLLKYRPIGASVNSTGLPYIGYNGPRTRPSRSSNLQANAGAVERRIPAKRRATEDNGIIEDLIFEPKMSSGEGRYAASRPQKMARVGNWSTQDTKGESEQQD